MAVLAALLLVLVAVPGARAQAQRYTLAVRGVALGEALETFVHTTGVTLAYDPALVRGHRAFCAVEDVPAEAILRCLLADSGLDFYRLSSGTYVLARRVELEPQQGYLSGAVFDRSTGAPLADAQVYLRNAGLGSVTNQSGQFVFPPLLPGRYALTVSYLGYQTWRDTLDIAPSRRVLAEARLEPEPILITPVVIDGLQHRFPSEALGFSAVEEERLAEGSEGTLGSGLQPLGGLPGVRVNDATAGVHLQGGASGAHQFRLDGVPVFVPRHLVGFVGPFNPFALDRITVHKAGFGAGLGSHLAGVVAAEHSVEGPARVDAQIDPLSFNARVRHAFGPSDAPKGAVMASARVGLWDVYQPGPLQETLNAWTVPDLFLILAPARGQNGPPGIDRLSAWLPRLLGPTNPSVHFSDLHAAGRLRLHPLRTLHASIYRGNSRLDGGVLAQPDAFFTDGRAAPSFTLEDAYDWTNTLGQVRYDAVLGSRTLASIQARGSRYQLTHDYLRLDSLSFGPLTGDALPALTQLGTARVRDGNHVQIVALEGSLDHARGRHHLRLGAEASHVDSRFSLLSVNLPRHDPATIDGMTPQTEYTAGNDLPVTNAAGRWWLAAYAEDGLSLGPHLTLDAGVRLTYRPERATVYAEPRAALRYDRADGPLGPWSTRTAVGLYRQFINEFDLSKLNAGALLPEVRVWLPLDASVRPPLAFHAAQSLLVSPAPGLSLRSEAYLKYQPHGLAIRYLPAGDTAGAAVHIAEQAQILTGTEGHAVGASVSAEWRSRQTRLQGLYEYSHAVTRSPLLFGGRTQPVPWNEPHHVELSAFWSPTARLTLSARWQGIWGRAWGFRRAYYDYFGHAEDTREQGPYDLGDPSAHVLPPVYQLDLGAAYTHPLGPAALQLRVDVLNALDRANVADWRLVMDGTDIRREERPLYPRIPSFALRLTF